MIPADNIGGSNWRAAVGSINDALAELQRACNVLVGQMAESDRRAAAATAATAAADKRAAEASANADSAIERARADAKKEVDEQRKLVEELRRDLQTDRERHEQALRAMEAERSAPPVPAAAEISELPPETVHAARVESAPPSTFEAAAYARQLLEHLESVYEADEASGITPTELVERLIANLTYASDVFARRAESAGGRGAEAFQQQLEITLDARGSVSFGRRLAIATFELPRRDQAGRAHVA